MTGNPERMVKRIVAGSLMAAILCGCSTPARWDPSTDSKPTAIIGALTPDIEALLLAWHDLEAVYKDIKFMERGLLFDANDRQLGYVQKAALYVQDAAVRIRHRWEQLAVLNYIRPAMLRDYLTLSVNGLTSARQSIAYDGMFLDIYAAHITSADLRQDLARAGEKIQASLDVMDRIITTIRPLANPTTPPTRI